jgi:hypothetical protein
MPAGGTRSSRNRRIGVQAPGEELDVAGLAAQHVHELEARSVAVLEVTELLGEHHRLAGAVAVEQRDLGVGVSEHAARDGDHGRDARARRDAQVSPAGVRVGPHDTEGAGRRTDLELGTHPDVLDQPAGEDAVGDGAYADAGAVAGRRADGVGATLVAPVDRAPDRQ